MTIKAISFSDVSISFPIFTADRSVRRRILRNKTLTRRKDTTDTNHLFVESLKNINLSIGAGQKVGLYGPNGAGKTTLLRSMTGTYKPEKGRIIINGRVTSLLDITIGFMDDATGYENITIQGLQLGMSFEEIKKKTNQIIEFSDLGEKIFLPVRTYSSGMRVRLAFSICTCVEPEILLLDEWLSVGDVEFQKKVSNRLGKLINDVSIVVIASHSLPLLRSICTEIIHMEAGSINHLENVSKEDISYYEKKGVHTD